MHQVQIDIEQCRLPFGSSDQVRIPNFLKQSTRRHISSYCRGVSLRQILFNSLPTHEPEKLRPPGFFIWALARVLCSQAAAELRSALTARSGCAYATPRRARAAAPTPAAQDP